MPYLLVAVQPLVGARVLLFVEASVTRRNHHGLGECDQKASANMGVYHPDHAQMRCADQAAPCGEVAAHCSSTGRCPESCRVVHHGILVVPTSVAEAANAQAAWLTMVAGPARHLEETLLVEGHGQVGRGQVVGRSLLVALEHICRRHQVVPVVAAPLVPLVEHPLLELH